MWRASYRMKAGKHAGDAIDIELFSDTLPDVLCQVGMSSIDPMWYCD